MEPIPLQLVEDAMQHLVHSDQIRSGCDLYTRRGCLLARQILGLAASSLRSGQDIDLRKYVEGLDRKR